MSEAAVVRSTDRPATRQSVASDLRGLGVEAGDVLIVHSSLSALGFVIGGAQAVVEALLDAVGPAGTVTMPGHSADWSEPSHWEVPPIPESWWPIVRAGQPAFDPRLTPLRAMGAIPETLHRHRETRRSPHPQVSHLALGPHAAAIVAEHPLADGLGDGSPLGKLYELDAKVLLLGVGHANNTSLHLAEWRANWAGKRRVTQGAAMLVEGRRTWVEYEELEVDTDDFAAAGAAFAASGGQQEGRVGAGRGLLMRQRALVDFAAKWFEVHRGRP